MALTPERKASVDKLSDEDLALEVAKAQRSRFQGELFDYATVQLQARVAAHAEAREEAMHGDQMVVQAAAVHTGMVGWRVALWVGTFSILFGIIGACLGAWATLHSAGCH